ncbi:MAG: glycoside hydrolase family 15 protein [Actinomycetota bacterium]|nr:glycoside hydrolase family 15 protein [Actinomycetota bacterium]
MSPVGSAPVQTSGHGVPIAAHRLLGDGASTALLRPDGEIDWWCAPELDAPPLLWSLLDRTGGAARWRDVRMAVADGPVAGQVLRTVVRHPGGRLECQDGLRGSGHDLVRLVRNLDADLDVVHELALGGFDLPWVSWSGAQGHLGGDHPRSFHVAGGADDAPGDPRWQRRRFRAPRGEWAALVVSLSAAPTADPDQLLDAFAAVEADDRQRAARAKYPRRSPGRSTDALRVLHACTDARTGAVVAAPTTSLPEAPGGDRQFDYRYSWLRDASLAVSVAALVGRRDLARSYLDFVLGQLRGGVPTTPVTDIRGGPVPPERQVPGVSGWGGSQPVRVGNAAADQVQYDALGLLVEAISVHLQLGAPLDRRSWELVQAIADHMLAPGPEETSGIWELRQPRRLVSADIGRWLALDRAVWIARGWRPWTRRRHWKRARDEARERILAAIDDEGGLSQSYDDEGFVPDASALMAGVFGLLDRRDGRAGRLVDVTLAHLGAWPFLYRYEPGGDDGFEGTEGAFLPTSWWAISALAKLGRLQEATLRLDALDRAVPRLMSEEIDPESLQALGNTPLVWSHMEAVRALYVLDAEERRQNTGRLGLSVWRVGRYLQQRFQGP